jgi:uncharacterized membrane protein
LSLERQASEASPPFRAGVLPGGSASQPGKEDGYFCIAPLDHANPGVACGERADQNWTMISSTPIEIWVIMQIVIDLCLIILFIIIVGQLRAARGRPKSFRLEQVTKAVEPVLKEAQEVAKQFETQLKEKQRIVKRLNERMDSRIISLNLLVTRTEGCLGSGGNVSGDKATFQRDVFDLQQQIMRLSEKGLDAPHIADRLAVSKGEVTLVLDLKKKFLEIERT